MEIRHFLPTFGFPCYFELIKTHILDLKWYILNFYSIISKSIWWNIVFTAGSLGFPSIRGKQAKNKCHPHSCHPHILVWQATLQLHLADQQFFFQIFVVIAIIVVTITVFICFANCNIFLNTSFTRRVSSFNFVRVNSRKLCACFHEVRVFFSSHVTVVLHLAGHFFKQISKFFIGLMKFWPDTLQHQMLCKRILGNKGK